MQCAVQQSCKSRHHNSQLQQQNQAIEELTCVSRILAVPDHCSNFNSVPWHYISYDMLALSK